MDAVPEKHAQDATSHQEYLDSLHPPAPEEARRISEIQQVKEVEINRKYHTHSAEEYNAATKIQAAYRGHRERREQQGLVLDPSSRWSDLVAEMKFQSVIAPHHKRPPGMADSHNRTPSSSDVAKMHWRRAGWIAEHAGRGENTTNQQRATSDMSAGTFGTASSSGQDEFNTMLMDLRYFLEMIDAKHRYGANLQAYHEVWQRQSTTQNFFYWLDHGAGLNLDLSLCSREKLDRERIRYLSREERKDYLVEIDEDGRLRWAKNGEFITTNVDDFEDSKHGIVQRSTSNSTGSPTIAPGVPEPSKDSSLKHDLANFSHLDIDSESSSSSNTETELSSTTKGKISSHKPKRLRRIHVSPATLLSHLLRSSVKPGTWIYVTDTLNRLYIGIKSSGAFQHASFLSGARISSAGSIGVQDGQLIYLSPLSGHYRPTTKSFRAFVESLEDAGADLSALKVSGAYKVLRGMEFYGRTKKGFRSVKRAGRDEKKEEKFQKAQDAALGRKERAALELVYEAQGLSATELIDQHWEREHARKKHIHRSRDA
jgi:hypothetical protein